MQKKHIQTQTLSSFDQDKNAQAVSLENPELVELTIWTSFEKVVSPLTELLLHEANQYINRDKNKPQFNVTLEKLKNFTGLIFLLGYNIRLAEQDYWSVDPVLRCDTFCETMSRNQLFEIKWFLSILLIYNLWVEPLHHLLNKKNSAIWYGILVITLALIGNALIQLSFMYAFHMWKDNSVQIQIMGISQCKRSPL